MYGSLALIKNARDGTYDLVISYGRDDAEFGLDFFAPANIQKSLGEVRRFVNERGREVKIRAVKVMVGGIMVATIPFAMMVGSFARFSMGYLYTGSASQQIQYVQNTGGALDTVSPSYFDIGADGGLVVNTPSEALIGSMHSQGIRVVPFVSNHWDRAAGIAALQDYDKLAREIADHVERYGLDGVHVDIENVTHSERELYTAFVEALRHYIPSHKEVSVAVAANPNGWTTGWHGSYDYAALGSAADYLMIMTYDEHYQGGPAGPVASIGFVERSIQYALGQGVPSGKIVVGLPMFGRIWGDNGYAGQSVPAGQMGEIIGTYGAAVSYDAGARVPVADFTVRSGDPTVAIRGKILPPGSYTIYYEDGYSITGKLALVDRYGLKGAASWSLGQEDSAIWSDYRAWLDGGEVATTPPVTAPGRENQNQTDAHTPESQGTAGVQTDVEGEKAPQTDSTGPVEGPGDSVAGSDEITKPIGEPITPPEEIDEGIPPITPTPRPDPKDVVLPGEDPGVVDLDDGSGGLPVDLATGTGFVAGAGFIGYKQYDRRRREGEPAKDREDMSR